MTRKFISILCATAVALTTISSTPAQADNNDDLARALAAVLGVAIIGKIIHDKKKNDRDDRKVTRRHQPEPVYRPHKQKQVTREEHRLQPRDLPRWVDRNHNRRKDHKQTRRIDRKLLPGQCLRSFDTRRGSIVMFGRRCLENNYRFTNRLPQHCSQRVRTRNGKRSGYDARCLRNNGYRLTRG